MNAHETQVVIFDWSGTISDDRIPVHAANTLMEEALGLVPNVNFKEWLNEQAPSSHDYFLKRGITLTRDEIWALYEDALNYHVGRGIVPVIYPDAYDVLPYLKEKGKQLAVISAHPTENLVIEAEAYGIADYFDRIIGNVKDKTRVIGQLLEQKSIDPPAAVYIGDTRGDMVAAQQAGVQPIAVAQGYNTEAVLRTVSGITVWENLRPALSHF